MKRYLILLIITTLFFGCKKDKEDGRLFSTNWNKVPINSLSSEIGGYSFINSEITDITFIDNNTGYLCGYWQYFDASNFVYKTTNGGETWSYFKGFGCGFPSFPSTIDFININKGLVSYSCGGPAVQETNDGGQTWNMISINGGSSSIIIDSNHIIIGFDISHDGGNTWNSLPNTGSYGDFSAIDSNYIISGGQGGMITKTTNLWTTWDTIYNHTLNQIYAVDIINQNTIMAASKDGILKTSDLGQNWSLMYSSNNFKINDIKFINSQTGFAVLSNNNPSASIKGEILKTNDGGVNWSVNYTCDFMPLHTLYIIDNYTIIAAGNQNSYPKEGKAHILRTTTQGN